MVGFAEIGSRSDAGTGDSPKSTDDSLTGFLQASPDRLKLGWCTRSSFRASPPHRGGTGPKGGGSVGGRE